MAIGDTALTVCSDSLLLLGARPISSFTEGTDSANLCDRLYPGIKKSTLEAYHWGFSFKSAQLARTINTPVNKYRYQYVLPSDRIGALSKVYNNLGIGAQPVKDWAIMGDKLITDYTTVVADYKFLIDEAMMPSYFIQLLKYMMAWHLAEPITDQISKTQYWQSVAVGSPSENNRGGYFRTAAGIDGQGSPTQGFEDFSLIDVRY